MPVNILSSYLEIPKEKARELCKQLRLANRRKFWTWQYWMCWGCNMAAKGGFEKEGDFSKRCAGSSNDHRGCSQVNEIFDRGVGSGKPKVS